MDQSGVQGDIEGCLQLALKPNAVPGAVVSNEESPGTLDCVPVFSVFRRAAAPRLPLRGVLLMAPSRMEPARSSYEDHLPQLLCSNALAPVFFASAQAADIFIHDGLAPASPFPCRLLRNVARRVTSRDLPFRILA